MTSFVPKSVPASSRRADACVKPGNETPAGDRIALLDSNGTILTLSNGWPANTEVCPDRCFVKAQVGASFMEMCREAGSLSHELRESLPAIAATLAGNCDAHSVEYACEKPFNDVWLRMAVSRLQHSTTAFAVVWTDISFHKAFERRAHLLAGRLLKAQEDERGRISREIHDDVNAKIAEVVFLSHRLIGSASPRDRSNLEMVLSKVEEISNVVRRLSHRLHSPLLDHGGIESALIRLCRDFETSTGIDLTFQTQGRPTHISQEISVCLYRVLQEALSNIGKHAQAQTARVVLTRGQSEVKLTISDQGKGFDPRGTETGGGLGLTNMEERVSLLLGTFRINSKPGTGTEIEARIPLQTIPRSIKGPQAYSEWRNEPAA
jgi:signal transduction histidine kinase